MKIFVLGSTGVVGINLIPLLIEKKHDVTALVSSSRKIKSVEEMGAEGAAADVFNKDELTSLVKKTKPEVIIHELTALKGVTGNFRKFDQEFEMTNRFRTEVTDTLLNAAAEVGTKRFIAQSFCGWPFERAGGPVKFEEDPLDPNPPKSFRKTHAAISYLEDRIKKAQNVEALALRYGLFYGPGTGIAKDSVIINQVRKRKIPIVGGGEGIWSFVHIKDAVQATVRSVTNGEPGLYNIVDDEPAPVSIWLPYLANVLGAEPPRKIPAWLAKILMGEGGVSMMTQIRGASNSKAKQKLNWQLTYPSWREGFAEGL